MAQALPLVIYRSSAPISIDDSFIGVEVGSLCITPSNIYYCTANTAGSAVWGALGGGSGYSETVVNASFTAENDKIYNVVASATATDPTPIEGKGYTVNVLAGTGTVGSVGYPIGYSVQRKYVGGVWVTNAFINQTIINVALALKANLTANTFTGRQTIDGFSLAFSGVNASLPAGIDGFQRTAINKISAYINGATSFVINATGIAFLAGKRIQGQLELSAIEVTNTAGTDNAFLQILTGLGVLALNAVGAATNIAVSLATKGTGNFSITTNAIQRFLINGSSGQATISNLAGTGDRVMSADNTGLMSAQHPLRFARTFNQTTLKSDAGNSAVETVLFESAGAFGDWNVPTNRLVAGRELEIKTLSNLFKDAGNTASLKIRVRYGLAADALTTRDLLYETTFLAVGWGTGKFSFEGMVKFLSIGASGSVLTKMSLTDDTDGFWKITTVNTTADKLLTVSYQFSAAFPDNKMESISASIDWV